MGATSTPVDLRMRAGLPYGRRFRMQDGKNTWANLADFEVRCQVRQGKTDDSLFLFNLTPYLTPSYDVNDIVVDLVMTGADTREARSAILLLTEVAAVGNYDLIISDVGVEDARAIPLASGKVKIDTLVTAAADV